MMAGDGFPSGMDRFAIDAGTAERLMTGAVDVADAPPQYRTVAATLSALRETPDPGELLSGPAAAEQIAAVVVRKRAGSAANRPRRSATRARVLAASVAAWGLVVTGGLAAAGALPDSAQNVAAAVLRQVGISVPSGDEEPVDRVPPPTTSGPISTTADSVTANPSGTSAELLPPTPDGSPTSPRGPLRADVSSKPALDAPPPPETSDRKEQLAADAAQENNGNGDVNGNAYGHVNGNGDANGHASGAGNGNGNGNAYGPGDVHGAGETP
jgi:hypothetical protein